MKRIIYIVLDGLADRPVDYMGGKTPVAVANTPHLDAVAKNGINGVVYTVGKGIAPESDIAVISILGFDARKYYTGRGTIEAIGSGIDMRDGDLAVRCNFATVDDHGNIVDRRAGRSLTTDEARSLAKAVNDGVDLEGVDFRFEATVGHRAVFWARRKDGGTLSGDIDNTDPAYIKEGGLGVVREIKAGEKLRPNLSKPLADDEGARMAAKVVNSFVNASHEVLERHPVNIQRAERGELKANIILCRDAGHEVPKLPGMKKAFGLSFACFAEMPVEIGIGRAAEMEIVSLPPPTEDLKADYTLRAKKVIEKAPQFDGLYVHLKGPDIPGHDGECEKKKEIFEVIDRYFMAPVLEALDPETYVFIVTGDHATPCILHSHSDDPVPISIYTEGIEADKVTEFSEAACAEGRLGIMNGVDIIPRVLEIIRKG